MAKKKKTEGKKKSPAKIHTLKSKPTVSAVALAKAEIHTLKVASRKSTEATKETVAKKTATKRKIKVKKVRHPLAWIEFVLAFGVIITAMALTFYTPELWDKVNSEFKKIGEVPEATAPIIVDTPLQINSNALPKIDIQVLNIYPERLITLPPEHLPRLGKDGASLTAYLFLKFEDNLERDYVQSLLTTFEEHFFDGRLKLYVVQIPTNDQIAHIGRCIAVPYTDRFYFQYLKQLGNYEYPPSYANALSIMRSPDFELSEYFLGRCVSNGSHRSQVDAEYHFASENEITDTALVLENHLIDPSLDVSGLKSLVDLAYYQKINH